MDFDNAKENIQPLASGRNVSLLQASLSQDGCQELAAQRKQLEAEIKNYAGNDPLEPWYAYICWIEQSYPAGGSNSGLQKVMHKCLAHFEQDERYKQDRRLIKLFIKFMGNQGDQIECYQQMYNSGIGTMLADFYIAWAYSYDLSGNMRKASDIFRLGVDCRAEPLEELKEAQQHFGYTVAQRMMYTDGEEATVVNQELNARRLALRSLHGQRRKQTITVGSIRTGAAIKSNTPGVVQSDGPSTSRASPSRNAHRQLEVFNDENVDVNMPPPPEPPAASAVDDAAESGKSSLRSIIDAARHQENLKEPIAWSKPHKHGKIFAATTAHDPAFAIHVDDSNCPPITNYERNIDKPFKYPANYVAKSAPQRPWITPVTIEDEPEQNVLPCYNKCMAYPRPNMEFSIEECRAYRWFKRRQPEHPFVLRHNSWFGTGAAYGVRRYPNFASVSKPQPKDQLDGYRKQPEVASLMTLQAQIYNEQEQQEYQLEEILAVKWQQKRNQKHGVMDMEETVLMPDEKVPRRKSFFPGGHATNSRKSVLPSISAVMEDDEEEEKDQQQQEQEEAAVASTSAAAAIVAAAKERAVMPPPPPLAANRIVIYEDEADAMPPPAAKPAPPPTAPSAFFDADETCSTQTFNIFLKSQAVSTPKAVQKQVPVRLFGRQLEEMSSPLPAPQPPPPVPVAAIDKENMEQELVAGAAATVATDATGQAVSPMLRKQLSTILETSEHGAHGSSGGTTATTTKSTLTMGTLTSCSTSSPDSQAQTTLTKTAKTEQLQSLEAECTPGPVRQQGVCTPGPTRLQRRIAAEMSGLGQEMEEGASTATTTSCSSTAAAPVTAAAGNFERLQLWESNTPSVPLLKSLRFQEDKTETVTRPLMMPSYQEDKTETLPKLPLLAMPEDISLRKLPAANEPTVPSTPISELSAKRICHQPTPEAFNKSQHKHKPPPPPKYSLGMFDDVEYGVLPAASAAPSSSTCTSTIAASVNKLADSFMADLSFIPETQPQLPLPKNKFDIFLDETMPPPPAPPSQAVSVARMDVAQPPAQLTIGPAHLTASFVKDFTDLSSNQMAPIVPSPKQKFSIFNDDSLPPAVTVPETQPELPKQETIGPAHLTASFVTDCTKLGKQPSPAVPKLKFLSEMKSPQGMMGGDAGGDYFEFNAATEMFARNLSMIKNSTLLPELGGNKRSISPLLMPKMDKLSPLAPPIVIEKPTEDDDRSIYFKKTPLTPKQSHHSWQESSLQTPPKANFEHRKPSIDESVLNSTLAQTNVNPFSVELINSLLDSIEFTMYIEKLPNCQLKGHVKRLTPQTYLEVHGEQFEVQKMIGKGAYGSVFTGVNCKSGKKVALKQEKPTNYWEYYICLELHSRLLNEELIPAFMHIDYALVGNNSSIYISDYSEYGSLINVCNKFKKHTSKNMDEYVVMHMCCQLLDIVDNLHSMGIIHADIKPDNLLLMKPLGQHPNEVSLQLIDFGVAIDTKLFPPNQTFDYVHKDDGFKCIEMRTQRRWTYQLDLFGLVGVMHVLLFGTYMEVVQRPAGGIWMPKQAFPRYVNRQTWESVFRALLNVPDCQRMPNLQELRTLLKSDLAEKEKYVEAAIVKFNLIMQRQN